MPRRYTKITPQIIEKVEKYREDARGFSNIEICRLVGISEHSLKRIIQGYYDQPVETPPATQQIDSSPSPHGKNVTEIPFEELEVMMKCKMFIEELFSMAILSDKADDELYFPRHYVSNMCNRYFPDLTQETLDRLKLDTNA